MKLKTYQARSIADALAKVKKDLGRDAVILHTRTLTRGGMLGIGSRSIIEITATNDARVMTFRKAVNDGMARDDGAGLSPRPSPAGEEPGVPPLGAALGAQGPRAELRGLGRPVMDGAYSAPAEAESASRAPAGVDRSLAAEPQRPSAGDSIRSELNEIRGMVYDLVRRARMSEAPDASEELIGDYTHLLSQEVSPELASEIIRRTQSAIDGALGVDARRLRALEGPVEREVVAGELRRTITEMLPPASPMRLRGDGRATVVALVGPTGVGKTTTIAKLAANMKLRENKRVGLITIDSYRIAAVEQLKTYAQILRVPIVTVLKPSEIQGAIEQMADMDLILIDTAGRSQKDGLRIAELNEFITMANPDQVHLVLSTTSKEKTIREAVDRFRVLGARHLIFTKLDEAEGLGVMLNVLQDSELRLSYLTTGQAVPDDIEIGSASRVARLILGESDMRPRVMDAMNSAHGAGTGEVQ